MILEACVETLEGAVRAEQNGADRIELCGDLSIGGVTPSEALTLACMQELKIPIMAMVRPRGGDFVYSEVEFQQMKKSVEMFKKMGVAGVVFGILDKKNEVNLDQTRELAELANPLLVTFHKAIDETPDPALSIKKLTQVAGIQRVLTSGGKKTALEGAEVLRKMKKIANGKITILAAGNITKTNLPQVQAVVRTSEYHGKRIVF
ncbi:MAG: copper homeostasis protein CutC [Bacteroidetes bacterium]|nr:copper homeostasis protein CutC [Bacteroidota bacterium]